MKSNFDLQKDNGELDRMIAESDGRLMLTKVTRIDFVRNYRDNRIVTSASIAISKIVRLVIKNVEPEINDRLE